jgi:hypothetical protein
VIDSAARQIIDFAGEGNQVIFRHD